MTKVAHLFAASLLLMTVGAWYSWTQRWLMQCRKQVGASGVVVLPILLALSWMGCGGTTDGMAGGSGGNRGPGGIGGDGGAGGDAFGVPADLEDEFIAAAPAYCMQLSECDDERSGGSVEECVSELRDGISLEVGCGADGNTPCSMPSRACAYDRIGLYECRSTLECESLSEEYGDCRSHEDAILMSCYHQLY
jgi:hypothetical protein